MKVYDIISEQILTEGFWADFTKWAFGASKKEISEKIGEVWAKEMMEAYAKGLTPKLTMNIRQYIPKHFRDKADDILKDALDIAKKRVRGQFAGKAFEIGSKLFKGAYKGAMIYGVARPIIECLYMINEHYKEWEAGDKSPESAQSLQHTVQAEINKCVQDVAAALIGSKILSKTIGAVGWLPSKLPFGMGSKIESAFNALKPAAKAAFVVWLQTDEGQKAFASWLVGEALLTEMLGVPGAGVEKWIAKSFRGASEWVGKFTKTWGIDPIIKKLDPTAPVDAASPDANKPLELPSLQQTVISKADRLAPKGRDAMGRPIN